MGFAASQARFLSLTSRMLDNEYEAGQIEQERLALADKMINIANKHTEATTNQYLVANIFDKDSPTTTSRVALDYSVITKDVGDGGLGMYLVTSSGLMVASSIEERDRLVEESNGEYTTADFFVFEDVIRPEILQENLEQGNFYLATKNRDDENKDWNKIGLDASNSVFHAYDTSDDAEAEHEYETEMLKAEKRDTMLEMRLEKLETNHKAIEIELESVEKVVDDNVEKSFKTFSA